ncbi:MAG TPA: FABP family protein [Acidimicrobiales bacterium]|nr:FABP family protein [Acidimicrobiales bacterium]
MDTPDLHPDCAILAGLLGTWRGEGAGEYPTIDPFSYREEVTFTHVGTPVLWYTQRTRNPASGLPMHAETGFWRPLPPDRVEVVIAHPTGVAEIQEGTVDRGRIELKSASITHTATAKEVTVVERSFRLDGDVLSYTLRMAAVGEPVTHHLAAELRRVHG